MYSLIVKNPLSHPDGRIFIPGHDLSGLSIFEVAELLVDYPDHFLAKDEFTRDLMNDVDKLAHYAAAARNKRHG